MDKEIVEYLKNKLDGCVKDEKHIILITWDTDLDLKFYYEVDVMNSCMSICVEDNGNIIKFETYEEGRDYFYEHGGYYKEEVERRDKEAKLREMGWIE